MRWRRSAAPLLSVLLLAGSSSTVDAALTVSEVAAEFICNCGCNKVLTECDMACGEQLRGIIKAKIEEGWDKPQIIRFMVENYGERLLAAPTKEGFNLTAWVTPFLALFAGAGLVAVAIRRWASHASSSPTANLDGALKEGLERRHGTRLDEELKRFQG